MPLIIAIVLLSVLKLLEVSPVSELSWWWIIGLFAIAFLWFEFGERIFGLDVKKDAHEQLEKARKERVTKTFKK